VLLAIVAALLVPRALAVGAQQSIDPDRPREARPKPPEVIHIDHASLDRLEQWLDAIATHTPGAGDEALERVQSWSTGELRTLWINATALLSLMRAPAWKKFFVTVSGLRQGPKPLTFTIMVPGKPAKPIR